MMVLLWWYSCLFFGFFFRLGWDWFLICSRRRRLFGCNFWCFFLDCYCCRSSRFCCRGFGWHFVLWFLFCTICCYSTIGRCSRLDTGSTFAHSHRFFPLRRRIAFGFGLEFATNRTRTFLNGFIRRRWHCDCGGSWNDDGVSRKNRQHSTTMAIINQSQKCESFVLLLRLVRLLVLTHTIDRRSRHNKNKNNKCVGLCKDWNELRMWD